MKKYYLITLLFCVAISMQAQNIITVDNNPGNNAQYDNLQTAIDAAVAGDIIYVQQSPVNYEAVTVNKGLSIIGRSSLDATYKTVLEGLALVSGSSDTVISGLDITKGTGFSASVSGAAENSISNILIRDCFLGSSLPVFFDSSSSASITNVVLRGNIFNTGLSLGSNTFNIVITNNIFLMGNLIGDSADNINVSNPNTVTFSNNIFRIDGSLPGWPLFISNQGQVVTISNSAFIANISGTPQLSFNDNYILNNCLTYNYGSGGAFEILANDSPINTINGLISNVDPMFTAIDTADNTSLGAGDGETYNPYVDNLIPQTGSPLIGGGTSGDDIGVYADDFNFKPFGEPAGVPGIKIEDFESNPSNGQIEVSIKAKTN